jgi:hypothetical protein
MAQVDTELLELPADWSEAWERSAERRAFWAAHYEEYLAKYPEQFVAVQDGKVKATNPQLAGLIAELRRQRIEPRDCWIEFLSADPPDFHL